MDVSSLILGGFVLLAAVLLQWRNPLADNANDYESELDAKYFSRRARARRLVHLLLAIIAMLAITAGVIGHGRAFILIWAAVPLIVFLIVVLALLDAYQTHRYHVQKLPEIRRASIGDIESDGNPN